MLEDFLNKSSKAGLELYPEVKYLNDVSMKCKGGT
jgi:hypothetical protein